MRPEVREAWAPAEIAALCPTRVCLVVRSRQRRSAGPGLS